MVIPAPALSDHEHLLNPYCVSGTVTGTLGANKTNPVLGLVASGLASEQSRALMGAGLTV